MYVNLKTTDTIRVEYDAVLIKAKIKAVKPTIEQAYKELEKVLNDFKEEIKSTQIPEDKLSVSGVTAGTNIDSYGTNGMYASRKVQVVVPFDLITSGIKCSSIINLFDTIKIPKTSFKCEYICSDIEKHKIELRRKLLDKANEQLEEILKGDYKFSASLEKIRYGDRVEVTDGDRNGVIINELGTNDDFIDEFLKVENAPKLIIKETLYTAWEVFGFKY